MAVLGRLLVGSGERLDLADLLSLDSYTAADFKYLIQSFIGADKPYILYGLDVISPQDAIGTENVSIRISDSIIYYPGSKAGSFYYGLEEGNINAQPLIPELRKNATNFVYATFSTFDTAKDSRAYWDPDQNGGEGGEFSQDVNTETALKIEINVSVSTFPENTIPICKVVVGASVISSIQDCRDQFFRLGTGGISPNPFSTYDFRNEPSSTYARLEPSTTMTSALNPNPFQGGDKNIRTLKEWMDVVMTRIKEIGGTTYWYQGSAIPGAGPNINNVFLDALGSTIKSKGEWQHSGTTPGEATWTEDIHYYSLIDNRDLIVRANTITLPSSDKVAWINLSREVDFNGVAAAVDWQNGINYVNGATGSFINLSKGDWAKKSSDSNLNFLRVEEFYALPALAGGTTTPALAQSIRLSDVYAGTTGTEVGQYTQGEYILTDINITDRDDPSIAAAGGNFFWLAYRSDTSLGLSLASSVTLSLNITDADGITAKCTHVGHGLVDKDRINIPAGPYAGTYVVEYESADVFYINTTVTGDDLGRAAYYGLITTAARSTAYSYSLETANHGFKSGETILIAGASPWNGQYIVNYRNATQVQIPISSALATTGPVAGEIVSLPRLNVRTEFGTVKVVAGETTNIGDMDSENLMSFIGMDSLGQTYPNYSVPNSYNALNGHQNYNSLSTDSLTTRVSRLTAMMADRVQDRGMQIIGRTNIRSVTNGANQEVSALADLTLKKPGSTDLTITMTSPIAIPANSIAVIDIDRDGSGSIVPTVESWGSNYVISENKLILFYRFADTNVYTWDDAVLAPSGHLNLHQPEDSQNRNVYAFNPGRVALNTGSGLLSLLADEAAEISRVNVKTANLTPQSSYFVMYSAKDAEKYVVWYNKDTLGTQPVVAGTTVYIEVNIATGDSAAVVASNTIGAINGAASVEVTASSYSSDTVLLTNDAVGSTTNIADGAVGTTYTFTVQQSGFDPDIEIIIPGAANRNIVDVDAINALGTLILADGQCAWVRINRFAAKTFNTISLTDTPDTDLAGAIYITNIDVAPIDQDVFILWTRIQDTIAETNKAQRPDGNVYDETYVVVAGIPSNQYELQGPVLAGVELILPNDSRDVISGIQEYIVGSGQLEIYLNGQYLRSVDNWSEIGTTGALSKRITLTQDLEIGDKLTFRIDAHGAVYFASDGSGGGDLQDSYDAGRFINISSGQPIVITGPASQKLMSIQGDIEVTGVIDPAGLTLSQEASDPLGASDYGFWRNASDQLIFKRGANPAFNFDTNFIRRDGSLNMLADLDLNNFKITNIAAPIAGTDAARKTDVDSLSTTINNDFIRRDGTNTMQANLDMDSNQLTNLPAPISGNDATRKSYVDTNFLKLNGGNPMQADLDMDGFKIVDLGAPTNPNDATRKTYVDSNFLKLDGTNPMAANLNFNGFKGTNLLDPTAAQDAATKNYVDTAGKDKVLTLYTNLSGSTINAGTIVYVTASGSIAPANASSLNTAKGTIGVATTNIAHLAAGYVQVKGKIAVNGTLAVGNIAYLSTSTGAATTTPPSTSGDSLVILGVATATSEVELQVQFVRVLENAYDETYDIVSGAPSNDYELTGPITTGTTLTLPDDSRDGGNPRSYIVGEGILQLYLNGDKLRTGVDYTEIGTIGTQSTQVQIQQDLSIGDSLTFVVPLVGETVVVGVGGGEANTASNVGTGAGNVFKQKNGIDLEFRRIKAGTNISVSQIGDDVEIAAVGSGEANTASNVGGGAGVFKQKTGVDLELRSLTSTSGVSVTQNASTIDISAKLNVRSISSTDTALLSDDLILVNTSGGIVTINLPAAASALGKKYYIKKIDSSSNNMVLDPNGAETIDGASTKTSNVQYEAFTIVCDGTTWWLV